ncbi:MAG: hypothetical protein IPG76_21525 [Acidobacteria bacterium]|nr:hypothetical protein [Acidobacteriota bacterium]
MRKFGQLVKFTFIIVTIVFISNYILPTGVVSADSDVAPSARTGAPGESTCTSCHGSFTLNSGPGVLSVTGVPASYTLNQGITVTVKIQQANRARYGFEVTVLDELNNRAGTLTVTDTVRTAAITGNVSSKQRSYITQTSSGADPTVTGEDSWSFNWTAPSTNVGKITFYVTGLAGNGSGSSGDYVYTTTANLTAPPSIVNLSAASYDGSALASEEIAAAFGTGMSVDTQLASTTPLPTTLAGTTVKVKDGGGTERLAQLFYVSPAQVNYLVPAGSVNGNGTVTIANTNGSTFSAPVVINTVVPGLFSATKDGKGWTAADVLRVRQDGSQSYEAVIQYDTVQNKYFAVPIDLGPATDQVYLLLYGTGVRFRSSLSAVTSTIGGTAAEVTFAGVQGQYIGLDQITVRIPRSLAGRGNVDVSVTVDTKPTNILSVNIK